MLRKCIPTTCVSQKRSGRSTSPVLKLEQQLLFYPNHRSAGVAGLMLVSISLYFSLPPLTNGALLAASTTITQEIVVDGETLIYIIYELDRRTGGVLPSAELVGYQKYKTANKTATSAPRPQPTISTSRTQPLTSTPSPFYSASQSVSYSRRSAQPSISCALTPVNNMRHLVSTPISF